MGCSRIRRKLTGFWAVSLCPLLLGQEVKPGINAVPVHLQVSAGTPLNLYVTKRVSYKQGEAVQAKFAQPVWAFDRVVIPAGTLVEGEVTDLNPVPGMDRAMAIVRGDFTPLKRAEVSFTRMTLPNGQSLALDTRPSLGLATIFVPEKPAKKQKQTQANPNSKSARARRFLLQQAQAQANARSHGLLDFVRGQNKREWIENFLWAKLPYHPQWYRTGTRFDAVLKQPLDFGTVTVPAQSLREVGAQPAPDAAALIRMTSRISSADAHVGDPVTAVVSAPVLSPSHEVVLPEGTQLSGRVTQTRPARMFHRGGQLRFTFESAQVPAVIAGESPAPERAEAQLTDAEPASTNMKVDSEGTAKATESKARFLRPIIAGLIAAKSMDNDTGKQNASGGANSNYSGQGLAGFSGFGLFGTAAAYGSRSVGMAFGYYGLAWSVYATVISRGQDVVFKQNSVMAIRFGARSR
ncbi:MAG: hypothetical protein JO138_15610 [Acidobacteriaceae bacterium]|nr:hypothetical protein [Acidobacteriaceae bacterium]